MYSFKRREACDIIKKYFKTEKKLKDICSLPESFKEKLCDSVERMKNEAVLDTLSDIPSDEVNRDKNKIKVKTLMDCGYLNLADLHNESEANLADINGISPEGARTIKQVIAYVEGKIREDLHLDLSKDSPISREVVRNAFLYNNSLEKAEKAKMLLDAVKQEADGHTDDLLNIKNGFKWLFTSASKKQRAIASFKKLENVLNDFNSSGEINLDDIEFIKSISDDRCYEDFSKHPEKYTLILDREFPKLFKSDDSVYNLPKALAEKIETEVFLPQGLNVSLRRYQEWGVKYILHQKRVLLGDEMGLGKTVQAIAAMVSMANDGASYFLVIAPAGVLSNWCREINKFCTLKAFKIHGDEKESNFELWKKQGGIAVTNFETTAFVKARLDFKPDLLVVDEAHYIKNPKAKRSENVSDIADISSSLLFMTGTAMENKVDEMLSLISILNPEIAHRAKGIAFLSNAPEFRDLIAPVYYRRKREDVLKELPKLIESMDWCELMPAERELYEQAVLDDDFTSARRVSWNVDDLKNSSKAQRLMEIVEDAFEDDRKVLVFSFFLDTLAKVKNLLGDKCLMPITGACSLEQRQQLVDDFSLSKEPCVLAAQIQAGGTGLNIQQASVVIICEPQFKPSIENQAISRAYRMGQKRSVLVHRLLCEDTADEKIVEMLEKKQRDFDAFADESSAAAKGFNLDNEGFAKIMDNEKKRIEEKNTKSDIVF